MISKMFKCEFQFTSIFEVLENQHSFLKNQTGKVIGILNQINKDINTINKKYSPKAFLFHNLGEHNEFSITLKIITSELKIIALYEYEIELNDGKSFGIDKYKDYVKKYPTEDYFSVVRAEYLNKLLFNFFLECFWNSKLSKSEYEFIFSGITDCDEFISLKDGLTEFQDLNFISDK